MSDDDYERIVKAAQDELAEHGESANVYIEVSVLLKSSELSVADLSPGMSCTDKGRQCPLLEALRKVHHVESNNTISLRLTYSALPYKIASEHGVYTAKLIGRLREKRLAS